MPGYYDNASPPEPPDCPCEAIDCELYDWVKDKCKEGYDPESCPHLKHVMDDDWKYHRRVDEGEVR